MNSFKLSCQECKNMNVECAIRSRDYTRLRYFLHIKRTRLEIIMMWMENGKQNAIFAMHYD
jgi:hypothetical protein